MGCNNSKPNNMATPRKTGQVGSGGGSSGITMGYWNMKGRGEYDRLIFACLKLPFKEENPAGPQEWGPKAKELNKKGLPFPNLPYIIDGDFMFAESMVIPFYLCKRQGRLDLIGGKSIEDRMRIKQLIGVMKDINNAISKSFFAPDYKKVLEDATKDGATVTETLNKMSKFLGQNTWLVGNKFTIADVIAANCFYQARVAFKSAGVNDVIGNKFTNLATLQDRVFGQPGVKEHIASDYWKTNPIYAPAMIPWMKEF